MKLILSQKKLSQIATKYDLDLLILFGSQVDNQTKSAIDSDVDVAYQSKRKLTGKELISFNSELIDVFDNDKVDLVNLRSANPLLLFEISNKSKLLFGDQNVFLEFKALAFKRHIDVQDLFELENFLINKRQKLIRERLYGK